MDERTEQTMSPEVGVTRRTIAKGVAAGGLGALFAAVGAGRVLADDAEGTDTVDDEVDTGDTVDEVDEADTVDTVDDDKPVVAPTGGARTKGKKLKKSGKKHGKGHH